MVPGLHRPEGDMSAPLSLSLSLALVKPKASLASEKQGGPSLTQVWLPHKTGRQAGASSLPHPHTATRETQAECFSQNPHSVHSNIGTSPSANPISSTPQNSPLPLLSLPDGEEGGPVANRRHSQCTHACLRQFSKVPVYLLSGRCPQNIMHHTYKSFTL